MSGVDFECNAVDGVSLTVTSLQFLLPAIIKCIHFHIKIILTSNLHKTLITGMPISGLMFSGYFF